MALCQQKTTSKGKTTYPKWVTKGARSAFTDVMNFADNKPKMYSRDRVAPLNRDQTTGMEMIRDYATGGAPDVTDEALGMIRSSSAGLPGLTDEVQGMIREASGGKLYEGAEDYMNPYIDQVLAPALRQIEEGAALERKRYGDMATTSGAYGDARHGVLENELAGEVATARGDVTGRAYADAWNQALAGREADLGRLMSGAGNLMTTGLAGAEAGLAGASGLMGTAAADQAQKLSQFEALLQSGGVQQQTNQNELDALYENYLGKRGEKFDKMNILLSLFGGSPVNKTSTGTSVQPDNSVASLAGGFAGAFL